MKYIFYFTGTLFQYFNCVLILVKELTLVFYEIQRGRCDTRRSPSAAGPPSGGFEVIGFFAISCKYADSVNRLHFKGRLRLYILVSE